MAASTSGPMRAVVRLVAMGLVATLALQLYFALRIAAMRVVAPESTTFQRSEIVRLLEEKHALPWAQQSVDRDRIAVTLKRAVIASEDAGFVDHHGVEWDAIEKAWQKNEKAQERAQAQAQRAAKRVKPGASAPKPRIVAKVVGGSTISQQLAKNLFLAGERTVLRKGQEFVITLMLEVLLGKDRILTVYLNNVEWGEGVFGAQAAAQHYFRVDAARLAPMQAARLAVMLPAPKRFEKQPGSGYILSRAGTIVARMDDVELP
jgi:monofunctional biosynthetic peptidoglycan transglycosylase